MFSGIFPGFEFFDGCKFEYRKPAFSEQLVLSHTLAMGQTMGPGVDEDGPDHYQYGATYVSASQRSALIGKLGSDGALRANIINSWTDMLTTKLNARVSSLPGESVVNADAEIKGSDYSAVARLINLDALFGSYHQKLNPELALGGSLMYVRPQMRSILTLGARYATSSYVATVKGNTEKTYTASFMRKVTDSISMATELEYSLRSRESAMKVAYEYTGRTARVRGELASGGTVGCMIEKMIMGGLNLQLSGAIDHKKKSSYKFGIGASMG